MQETKTITLPVSKKQVVVKGYMTAQIDREIQSIFAAAQQTHYESMVDSDKIGTAEALAGQTKVVMDSDPLAQFKANDKMIELMVISLAGDATNILERVMALPKDDVAFIFEQLNSIESDSKVVSSDPKAPPSN
jgi:hypothetical protein